MGKKKKTILTLIEWLVFALIAFFAVYEVNEVLKPKYIYQNSSFPTTSTFYEFYKMKPDTVDVLFFGSSVGVDAFSPQQIYNEYGIRSYNLSSEAQSIFMSYYWLKEALRFQHPKAVVMDLYFLGPQRNAPVNMNETMLRKCIDPMKWSPVKAEAVKNIMDASVDYVAEHPEYEMSSATSFYLPNIRFHNRWSTGLEDVDFKKEVYTSAPLKGWTALLYYIDPELKTFTPFVHSGSEDRAEVHELMAEYLLKIGELCREEDIQLILLNLPGCGLQPYGMIDGFVNTCSDLAKEAGADYYNLGEKSIYEQMGVEFPDWPQSHANFWGSVKLSRYIGKMLKEQYNIPAVEDEQYESTRAFYDKVVKDANLQYIDSLDEYLEAINDPDYTVFFSVCADGTKELPETAQEKLREMGITSDLSGREGVSWIAVVDPETGVTEQLSENEPLDYVGEFGPLATRCHLKSTGTNAGDPYSSITINSAEYCNNCGGLNIVVWDNVGRTLIDSVTFDTENDLAVYRFWFGDLLRNGEEVAIARW